MSGGGEAGGAAVPGQRETTLVRDQGVTAASGFRAAGIAAGIKASGGQDLALVLNEGPDAAAAGVFTRNKVKAAPVVLSTRAVADGALRAVVLNSGGANACTGAPGLEDAERTAEAVASALSGWGSKTQPDEVAVCSTGLIGDRLPMPAVLSGAEAIVHELAGGLVGGADAARAIMTTDTVPKQAAVHHAGGWNIGGMAKGAGMLAPSLATMLCVVTTDAVAAPRQLDAALRRATGRTFDRLDVDGATSTNDTVLLLASGASGVAATQEELDEAVFAVCDSLADQLMSDAEGATKRIAITVSGAATEDEALIGARAIARDSLVKTALFGSDPNWGRVLAAIGVAPIELDPDRIRVSFNGAPVCIDSVGAPGAREADLTGENVHVVVELGIGGGEASIRTTDLSHAYVEENSAYSS